MWLSRARMCTHKITLKHFHIFLHKDFFYVRFRFQMFQLFSKQNRRAPHGGVPLRGWADLPVDPRNRHLAPSRRTVFKVIIDVNNVTESFLRVEVRIHL